MELPLFYDSIHCQSGAHCDMCRERSVRGGYWRASIRGKFRVEGPQEFHCPKGYRMHKPGTKTVVLAKPGDENRYIGTKLKNGISRVTRGRFDDCVGCIDRAKWLDRMHKRLVG